MSGARYETRLPRGFLAPRPKTADMIRSGLSREDRLEAALRAALRVIENLQHPADPEAAEVLEAINQALGDAA